MPLDQEVGVAVAREIALEDGKRPKGGQQPVCVNNNKREQLEGWPNGDFAPIVKFGAGARPNFVVVAEGDFSMQRTVT